MSSHFFEARVASKSVEADGIAAFELVALDGAALPEFAAGAHIDVQLPGGLTRQYSLCNSPADRQRYVIGVLRDPATRGGSAALHDRVEAGQTLVISAPKNHFPLDEGAGQSILLAGGIGVTPMLAMAERLQALGASFELHYCTRSLARTAFVERLRAAPFAARVQFHHDDGEAAQKLDLALCLAQPAAGTQLYVCGPKGFLDAVRATARDKGWPDAQVHFEYFSGGEVHGADDLSFELVLQSSGKVIRVEAAQTVAEALAAQGVEVALSCQQGVCGTCLTRVLEGEVDHKDLYLSAAEQAANDQFLPCCSRAKGKRLVVDL